MFDHEEKRRLDKLERAVDRIDRRLALIVKILKLEQREIEILQHPPERYLRSAGVSVRSV